MNQSGKGVAKVIKSSAWDLMDVAVNVAKIRSGVKSSHIRIKINNVQSQLSTSTKTPLAHGSNLKGARGQGVGNASGNKFGVTITPKNRSKLSRGPNHSFVILIMGPFGGKPNLLNINTSRFLVFQEKTKP